MTAPWPVGTTRIFAYHPVSDPIPDGAEDRGVMPLHHGRYSRLIRLPDPPQPGVGAEGAR